jgi:hypothetical protein
MYKVMKGANRQRLDITPKWDGMQIWILTWLGGNKYSHAERRDFQGRGS